MTECEEEIESLNSNLDTKNEFISALQRDNANKKEETEYLVNQLQKTNNVVKWDLILTNIDTSFLSIDAIFFRVRIIFLSEAYALS